MRLALGLIALGLAFGLLGPSTVRAQVALPSFVGLWLPRVGEGAEYEVHDRQSEVDRLRVAVVGREADQVWLEVEYLGLDTRVVRQLVGPQGTTRVIWFEGDHGSREFVRGQWRGGGLPVSVERVGRALGTETLELKCGTFACRRYQVGEGRERALLWVSDQVAPYGLVRLQSLDIRLELGKRLTGVKSLLPPGLPLAPTPSTGG